MSNLPDYDAFEGFGVFSGYVQIPSSSKKIHYLFVQSAQDPVNDPLILWTNGGPGCSSMLGFMQEHGPLKWEDGAKGMIKNDYSWNREANVLYVEQPAGVGYSTCGNSDECHFDDNNVAEDNLQVVLEWFKKFPEYQDNEFYLSGESYAGIYVPYLLNQINSFNKQHVSDPDVFKPNLKGMIVGNGVTNWQFDCQPSFMEMGFYHSLIDEARYQR